MQTSQEDGGRNSGLPCRPAVVARHLHRGGVTAPGSSALVETAAAPCNTPVLLLQRRPRGVSGLVTRDLQPRGLYGIWEDGDTRGFVKGRWRRSRWGEGGEQRGSTGLGLVKGDEPRHVSRSK